jgi:hypothetical protein
MRRILLSALFTILVLLLNPFHAAAEEEDLPVPSTSTEADFYVSWDHGDDANPGTFEEPFKTPDMAVKVLKSLPDPSGKVVLIREGWYRHRDHDGNRIFLKELHGSKGAPIQIRGYPGETVVLDAFLKPFNPKVKPFTMECGWGGICFSESSHIIVENFVVMGRCIGNIELLNSDYITVRFITSARGDKHGLFTGGSFEHLTIEACKFYENMYGSTASHGVYISGGHWNPDLPPVRNIWIRYVESYFNGRHGIQFNGRIEDVVVEHCNLHHNVLGGLSLIGVRNCRAHHNLMYKNNKQGIILYTYFDDHYWDPDDPESLEHWKATHWTIEDIQLDHNTIYMDDMPWYIDEWVAYNPTYHAGIYMVDSTDLLPPFKNIFIHNNIIYNHSDMVVNFANIEHVPGTVSVLNLYYSPPYVESVACYGLYSVPVVEAFLPWLWFYNLAGHDPLFENLTPTNTIDGTGGQIDFSDPIYNQFEDDFHLQDDSPALLIQAGAFAD